MFGGDRMSVRVLTIAAVLAASSFSWSAPLEAQTTRYREPAEFPPASFTGSQYVDSRGCIFVRAGIAGSTTWVPRVTSARANLCGARPTFADGTSAQTSVTAQGLPPGAVVITAPPAPGAQAQAQAQTRPQPTPRPAPVPTQRPQQVAPVAPVAQATVNARVAPLPPAVAARPGPPMQTIASITTPPTIRPAAQGGTRPAPSSLPSIVCPAGVRCGPQTQDPVPRSGGGTAYVVPPPASMAVVKRRDLPALPPQTAIVPRHVAQMQSATAGVMVVPPGYRPVWEDDRLNPRRAHGTVAGQLAMDLIWTDTVPRRLIDRRTGRDMTAFNPNLQYPYTDLTTQIRDGVPVGSRAGEAVSTSGAVRAGQQPAAVAHVSTRAAAQPQPKLQRQAQGQGQAQVQARMQPQTQPTAQPQQRVAGRFVQVGAFADPNNADGVIRRLQAAGLPVSVQRSSSRGKPVQVILAGPFDDPGALSRGLGQARAAGFRDAFARH